MVNDRLTEDTRNRCMKILAVIPARSNSKRIPNKCIRIVNNKPLLYYSIETAKRSKYISEIIVTTDSNEVAIIAKQMNVDCKMRTSELCTDETTLDSVVYDAMGNRDYDYVITLQPTTPLLKVETLDSAIEYVIEKELDTLVSVHNSPKLAWKKTEGDVRPEYIKRLNSQYLPPYFQETGAFVINKKGVVTSETRFAGKLDIYETSAEEAINVSDFKDLALVNAIMRTKKVAIYVNGNNKMGMGHVYRVLELADEFYCKPDIYYDINQTDRNAFGNTSHRLIPVNGAEELFAELKKEEYDCVINDVLSTSLEYMEKMHDCVPDAKIVNFEDDGDGAYSADLVINALYSESKILNAKCGEKYYIAPKQFLFYNPIEIKEHVEHILVTFGGADPKNYTGRMLNIINNNEEKYENVKFTFIVGRANIHSNELLKYGKRDNIEVLYDIDNMPEIMTQCDVAFTSRGRTGFELAILGIPSVAIAQNDREERHNFMCHENGFDYLGQNPSDAVLELNLDLYLKLSRGERCALQKRMLDKDLRNGRRRVMNLINSL